jgi:hypothetical protein
MVGAGLLFFIIFSLLIFLFLWNFTRPIMLTLLAWGIGLTITIVLKMILTTFCECLKQVKSREWDPMPLYLTLSVTGRKRFFRAFYRQQPGKMNISSLVSILTKTTVEQCFVW